MPPIADDPTERDEQRRTSFRLASSALDLIFDKNIDGTTAKQALLQTQLIEEAVGLQIFLCEVNITSLVGAAKAATATFVRTRAPCKARRP